MLYAIVMAGGSGTRFWPSSRVKLPKQLLPLAGTGTLIQDTVARLDGLIPPERTLVVTNTRLTEAVQRQLPELPETAIVGEPCKRDTAPCIGLAALLVLQQDPDATMAVMPSDHVIDSAGSFRSALQQANSLVDQSLIDSLHLEFVHRARRLAMDIFNKEVPCHTQKMMPRCIVLLNSEKNLLSMLQKNIYLRATFSGMQAFLFGVQRQSLRPSLSISLNV